MHTWYSTFQRHANSFVKARFHKVGKAEIVKLVKNALDRKRGEAFWASAPESNVSIATFTTLYSN
jgi:hypothetical protein